MVTMSNKTASERAKDLGAYKLADVARHYQWSESAFYAWFKSHPQRFDSLVRGYVEFNRLEIKRNK